MFYAYANLSRDEDGKTISTLYIGADETAARESARDAIAGGAESAVVKLLGGGVVYHVTAPLAD